MQVDRETMLEAARFAGAAKFYPEAQSVKEQNYVVSERFLERYAQVIAQRAAEAQLTASEKVLREAQENHQNAANANEDNCDLADWYEKAALVYGRAADAIRARGTTKEK